jgi:hypothetical protein
MYKLHLPRGCCRHPVDERDTHGATFQGIDDGGEGAKTVREGRGEGRRQGAQLGPSIVLERRGAPVAGLDSRNGAVQWDKRLEAFPGGGGRMRVFTKITALHPPGPRRVPPRE